jgi:20S proteasome subunit beta 3
MGSIMQYNGSAIVAMCGKDCVAIASDTRFGIQLQTVATDMHKVFRIHDTLYIGLAGLATDMTTVKQLLEYRTKMYKLTEERDISPQAFANLVSTLLYEKRFGPYFIEPVIAGLDHANQPYICAMDLIGAPVTTKDFLVGGTASEELYGTCESLYRPDLEPEDLFETISQALLAGVNRDCLSGWGAVVHVITPTQVISRKLKSKQD